jgi:nitroreductase / dihydropteridine reductase
MDFNEIIMSRYATKKFDGKKIEEDTVEQICDMTRYAPSALNIQPWKIKVVKDQETKDKLSAASMDQPQIATCSHLMVFCADTDMEGNAQKLVDGMKKMGIPEENLKQFEGVIEYFLSNFGQKEAALSEAQANVFIAATTAIYAAKSLGVDSCPMQGFDPAAYSEILNIPSGLVPTIIVPLGYPADNQMPKMRFPMEDIFF